MEKQLILALVVIVLVNYVKTLRIKSKCLENAPVYVKYGVSFSSCARGCRCMAACVGFKYQRTGLMCAFYDDLGEASAASPACHSDNFVYTNGFSSGPFHRECSDDDTDTYCPAILHGAHMKVKGNVQSVGSNRKLRCENPYTMSGPRQTTCQADAGWSDYGTCEAPITCPTPVHGPGMIFTDVQTEDAAGQSTTTAWNTFTGPFYAVTTISITCAPATRLIGPSDITCETGTWSTSPECKPSNMFQPCVSNDDCVDLMSECRQGQCWCQRDYSYSPSTVSCVRACPMGQYGSSFQVVDGYRLRGHNHRTVLDVWTEQECEQECLNANDYTCTSADYRSGSRSCYLNTQPEEDVGLTQDRRFVYLKRDCA